MTTQNTGMISRIRSTIETAFYGNNVIQINSVQEAYQLAKMSPGTVVTDMDVYNAGALGLEDDAKVLLFNDGEVTGRCAAARKIVGDSGIIQDTYSGLLRDAVYASRGKKLYHAQVYVGLHSDFMVKANLLIPEGHENILYNWMMNFQATSDEYDAMYKTSKVIEGESEIFIFSDPDWVCSDHPLGMTLFDSDHNCAALLGMKYFGEHKKGTLTLGWSIGSRNGYVPCHGGLKKYTLDSGKTFVASVFGLSGSGKSTLTHYKHDGKYDIEILHDDAFLVSHEDGTSVALEPAYFDKTQDYPAGCPDNKFLISAQNCGATRDENGKCVLLTEDIRNGNGRAIKSKFWADNRVDFIEEKMDAIIWLMKDPAMPPVLKIDDPVLAATMGATLATKRSTAERIVDNAQMDALVIEPYANPFRTYPLEEDFNKFLKMFRDNGIKCYILNTGHFGSKKITKEVTLECLETIVEADGKYVPWGPLQTVQTINMPGYEPDWSSVRYTESVMGAFEKRMAYLNASDNLFNKLPSEAAKSVDGVLSVLKAMCKQSKIA